MTDDRELVRSVMSVVAKILPRELVRMLKPKSVPVSVLQTGTVDASRLMVTNGIARWVTPGPHIRLSRLAAASIANSTWTAVSWDTIDYDSTAAVAAGSSVTVDTAGVYSICAGVGFAANATGVRGVRIVVDSVVVREVAVPGGGAANLAVPVSVTMELSAGSVVSVEALQTSGGSLALAIATGRTAVSISQVSQLS